jgi:hypothetical protein
MGMMVQVSENIQTNIIRNSAVLIVMGLADRPYKKKHK